MLVNYKYSVDPPILSKPIHRLPRNQNTVSGTITIRLSEQIPESFLRVLLNQFYHALHVYVSILILI